jgi:hypothetical protein
MTADLNRRERPSLRAFRQESGGGSVLEIVQENYAKVADGQKRYEHSLEGG